MTVYSCIMSECIIYCYSTQICFHVFVYVSAILHPTVPKVPKNKKFADKVEGIVWRVETILNMNVTACKFHAADYYDSISWISESPKSTTVWYVYCMCCFMTCAIKPHVDCCN